MPSDERAPDERMPGERVPDERAPGEPTIPALLAVRRRLDSSVQALVSDEDAITFAGLDEASRRLAARLVAAGVGRDSRVGLVMPNGIDWAVLALAVTRVGGVLVPLSTLLRPPELLAQLRTAAVTELVVVPRFRGRAYLDDLEEAVPGLTEQVRGGAPHAEVPSLRRLWLSGDLPTGAAPGAVVDELERSVRPADDLVILFTSGSSGGPKGVIHTHGNALRAVESGLGARRIGRGERLYIPMPFFWTGGLGGGLLSALVAGATLLTEAEPEPARTLRFLERERVTLFRGWPDQAARLAAHPDFATTDLSSLRPASLGAVLPPGLRAGPGARANLFGMTETFGPYCGSPLDTDLPAGKHGSCGRPFAGVEVRITDPGTGAPLPPGTEGEIRLRGPNLMRGIRGRHRADVFDADGFYPTADAGVLDEDGYLWYRGRLDDMFKVKGATVYPLEVEAALRALPGVREAFVTDVAGEAGGRQVAALVVAALPEGENRRDGPDGPDGPDGRAGPDGLDRADDRQGAGRDGRDGWHGRAGLVEQARARLSSFKVPTRWLVVNDPHDVPRLASGKVDGGALRRLLQEKGA
ncbi:class I adenylate-forming enzyme family protein [Pseudofrankia sp. BMG5.36]|uniref:class I adenylate-forming enzyme family protein n=2 Tax=unclassified Pseudofrankia TaxID=2994372 RepID=UPI0009F31059|nr:class I adenylate-forming enzyme family protein [Pseudofrankia sp. BMG5.36]